MHLRDRGTLLEAEAKTPQFEAEAVKIAPRGCLEARQCLEAPQHWLTRYRNRDELTV